MSLIDIENMQTKPNIKHLTDYFDFLIHYAKLGDEESKLLLNIEAISTIVNFYMNYGKISNEFDTFSDNEDDEFDER